MLALRKARLEDCDLLYEWANEKECRKNSFSQEEIPYEGHVNWLQKRLQNDKSDLMIAMDGTTEVGMLRLDYDENKAMISYSVAVNQRRKGYGNSILQLAEEYVREYRKEVLILIGEVKTENISSMHRFMELGYEEEVCQGYLIYSKSLQ